MSSPGRIYKSFMTILWVGLYISGGIQYNEKNKGVNAMSFGQNLQFLRKICSRMTQEDLAKAVGVDRATVSMWENGHQIPHASHRAKIEQVLNISYHDNVIVQKV